MSKAHGIPQDPRAKLVLWCPMCQAPLTVLTTPGAGDFPAVSPGEKFQALKAYLVSAIERIDEGRDGFMLAVHLTITAGGMCQAEMPELAAHDCYGPEGATDANN